MQRYPIPVYTMSEFASYGGLSTFARTKGAKDKEERKPRGKFGQAMDAARGAAGKVGSAMGSMPTGGKVAAGAGLLAGGAGLYRYGGAAMKSYNDGKAMRYPGGKNVSSSLKTAKNLLKKDAGKAVGAVRGRLGQLGSAIMANKGKVAAGGALLAAAGGAGAYALNRMKKNKAKKAEAAASQAREAADRKKFGPAYGAVQAYRNRTGRK